MINNGRKDKSFNEFLDIELQKEKTKQLEILRDIKRLELEMKKKEYETTKQHLFNMLDDSSSDSSSDESDINQSNKSGKSNKIIKKINGLDYANISIISNNTYETLEEVEIITKSKKEVRKGAPTGNRTQIFSLED